MTDKKHPNSKPQSNSKAEPERRKLLKTFVIGAGSVTFVKYTAADAQTEVVPPVVSLILDDDDTPIQELQLEPAQAGGDQVVAIPDGATEMDVAVYGAGGAGSGTSQSSGEITYFAGNAGGTGGGASANFDLSGINSLTVQVGEGGVAGETIESGTPGEFGGAIGGFLANTSSFPVGSTGGAGGGYSAVLSDDGRLLISAGGGGGAGGSSGFANAPGGAGGNGGSNRDGEDGSFSTAGSAANVGEGGSSLGGEGSSIFVFGSVESSRDGLTAEASEGAGRGADSNEGSDNSGGAGGGGGGGIQAETAEGNNTNTFNAGGGGGGGSGDPLEDSGGGGGGSGGTNYVVSFANNINADLSEGLAQGGAGGAGGAVPQNPESGSPGRVLITFR